MTKWNKESHDHVFAALRNMLITEPFYAHLAFNLPWVQKTLKDDAFSTDGSSVIYDPDKVLALMGDPNTLVDFNSYVGARGDPQATSDYPRAILKALVAATLTRIALRHPFRAERWGMNEAEKQAIASDSAIYSIVMNSFAHFPSKAQSARIEDAKTMVFEQIYDRVKLPPQPPKKPEGAPGGSGMSQPGEGKGEGSEPHSAFGNPMDGEGDPAGGDPAEQEENIKQAVERATKRAKEAGKLPGKLMVELEKANASKKDWREDIRKFLGGGEIPEQDWSKPNRRFIADDIYLPGNPKFGPGKVVLFVDTSGSVDDKLLSRFMAEVEKINVDLQPEEIWVVATDTRIQWKEKFGPYDSVYCKPLGRGGTDFTEAFTWLQNSGIDPKAVVFFSDLCVSRFGPKPNCPVLWVLWPDGSDSPPPFGEVIRMT